MQPELLSKHQLTLMFVVALVIAAVVFVLAIVNAVIANRRVGMANPLRGTAQYIIASQIKRNVFASIVMSVTVATFTSQALYATRQGTFALTKNWFSLFFISLIYVPTLMRLTLILLEFRDRAILEHTR